MKPERKLRKAMTSEEATEAQRLAARFVLMGQNGESHRQAASPVPSSIQAEDKAASRARGILGDN